MVDRYGSGGTWEDGYGYSRVVVAGPFVLVAGTTATVSCSTEIEDVVEVEVEAYQP